VQSPVDTGSVATRDERRAANVARAIRIGGIVLFAGWVWRYMQGADSILHGSILIFHEAGHLIFMPFGEFMMVLGGSIFQLVVPAFFVAYFARRRDVFAACFAAIWLAASLANLALYIGDARAGKLPLLGGERSNHDWTFLLIEMKMLQHDVAIGRFVHNLGVTVFWMALAGGVWAAASRAPR
jgi:hypothetical protein